LNPDNITYNYIKNPLNIHYIKQKRLTFVYTKKYKQSKNQTFSLKTLLPFINIQTDCQLNK